MRFVPASTKRALGGGSDHSVLGETDWRKILMGKIGLCEGGRLRTSWHLKLDKTLTLDICKLLDWLMLPTSATVE